jgi:hypothetical protein
MRIDVTSFHHELGCSARRSQRVRDIPQTKRNVTVPDSPKKTRYPFSSAYSVTFFSLKRKSPRYIGHLGDIYIGHLSNIASH